MYQVDVGRWSDIGSFSEDWDRRACAVSAFIPKGMRILDVGCGRMSLEAFCPGSHYFPADLVARDERTIVIDINRDGLPECQLNGVDLVTMLGVVEYVSDFSKILEDIAASRSALLFTYCAVDFFPKKSAALRYDRDGWFNSFSISDLCRMTADAGFKIVRYDVFDGSQAVFLVAPLGAEDKFEQAAYRLRSRSEIVRAIRRLREVPRKKLVLAGFFGRGNAGDEALLQCVYESFCDDFDIAIAVDGHGAYKGFWDWYPYNKSRIFHQCATEIFFQSPSTVAGLIVGGGGLPVGFCANLVFAAKANGIPVVLAGVDLFEDCDESATRAVVDYLNLFDFFSYRSEKREQGVIPLLRCENALGADWALRLCVDEAEDINPDPQRAVLVLREYPQGALREDYLSTVREVVRSIEQAGYKVVMAPFCPEDVRFLDQLGVRKEFDVVELWSNPRRMKQLIACSGLLVSIGRLHPILFGVDCPVRIVAVAPPVVGYENVLSDKIIKICRDFGVPFVFGVDQFKAVLPKLLPVDREVVLAAKLRLDRIVDRIYDRLV